MISPVGPRCPWRIEGPCCAPSRATCFIDGNALDVYGDVRESSPAGAQLVPSKQPWSASLDALDGTAGFQVRITFVSGPISGLTPSLSSLGLF